MINYKNAEEILRIIEALKSIVTPGPKEFFTVNETCAYLGVSRTTLYHLRVTGKLESIYITDKKIVIPKTSVDGFVQGQRGLH